MSADSASADSSTGTGSKTKRTLNMADIFSGIVTADVQTALQTLRFGGEATLQDIVYSLSASIDAKLLNLMMSRFYVQTHLLALKKFMLLGQVGVFVYLCFDVFTVLVCSAIRVTLTERIICAAIVSSFHIISHNLSLQGDFVTCLMDGVGPELKRRANQLFRHNLTGILEGKRMHRLTTIISLLCNSQS